LRTPSTRDTDGSVVRDRISRLALFAGGLALTAWLINAAGLDRVLAAIREAGPWLPAVLLLEIGLVATDMFAARALLGDAMSSVSPVTWMRSAMLAYASTVVLPAGRAAGEAVRATTLAPAIGFGRATGVCSRLQACVLASNAAISFVIAAVVFRRHVSEGLVFALLANATGCSVLSFVVFAIARSKRVAHWLKARFKRLAQAPDVVPMAAGRAGDARAIAACLMGRVIEATQYGIVLHAVGGLATPATALTAQGIHLVGAAAGDLVPNQMGITEGAYRLFTQALGLGDARALSIALVVRIVQLTLTGACFVAAAGLLRQPRSADVR
jgi:uncharacterized membrane protein YbhN (UPF0104 family)